MRLILALAIGMASSLAWATPHPPPRPRCEDPTWLVCHGSIHGMVCECHKPKPPQQPPVASPG